MNLFEMYDMKSESVMYYFLFFGLVYIILSAVNKNEENSKNNFIISFFSAILFSLFYSYITFPGDTLDTSNFWG
jgi:FtsH-binding integral membrane protein